MKLSEVFDKFTVVTGDGWEVVGWHETSGGLDLSWSDEDGEYSIWVEDQDVQSNEHGHFTVAGTEGDYCDFVALQEATFK